MIPSRLGNPSTGLVEDLLIRERTLFVTGSVTTAMSDRFIANLLWLAREDSQKPIYVMIDSLGGYLTPGLAMVDAMRVVKPEIHMLCIGWAVSMGAVLLSSGAKGQRCALQNCQIMIHQPSGGTAGMISDQEIEIEESRRLKAVTADILAENTGKTRAEIMKDFDRNFYMTSEQAMEYGLIDHILTANSYPPGQ